MRIVVLGRGDIGEDRLPATSPLGHRARITAMADYAGATCWAGWRHMAPQGTPIQGTGRGSRRYAAEMHNPG